jgi:tetratricopeptide (TPR) repeat protein
MRALAQAPGDPWVRAMALQLLSHAAENVGEIDDQRLLLRAAHPLFVEVGDRFGLGMVVHALGELEDVAGEYEAAARAYDEAVALAAELGNDDDLPQFLARRALLDVRRGDIQAARATLCSAVETAGDRPTAMAVSLWGTSAQVELMAGDLDAARALLDRVELETTEGAGLAQRRAFIAASRAAVELAAADLPAARRQVVVAVEAAVEGRDGPVSAVVAEVAARLALAEGDAGRAATLLGVAATQRGAVDRGNPDVRATYREVRRVLGDAAAEEAERRGREQARADGMRELSEYSRLDPVAEPTGAASARRGGPAGPP